MQNSLIRVVLCASITGHLVGCGTGSDTNAAASRAELTLESGRELEPPPEPVPLPPGVAPITAAWTGDLDGMIERRVIRVLTVQSPTLYFIDKGRELGLTYEAAKAFESRLNEQLDTGAVKLHVVLIPVGRDELLPRLLSGQGDIAAATLTITPERLRDVDFSTPFARDISEILVTAPGSAALSSLDEISGKTLHVRASSSYAEHLRQLNARFANDGKAPVEIVAADELLEDGDLLEMVAAGLIPAVVVDSYQADLWVQVFPDLNVQRDIEVATGGEIGWAMRKASPKLKAAVDDFVREHKQGTLMGNIMINRYLKTTKWVENARSDEDMERLSTMAALFQKYADRYELDWLLMAAQAYQESGLDHSKRSHVGAIGVMQVMPATARDKAVNIPDIEILENNIHAGIKYDRWLVDNFHNEPGVDPAQRALFAIASYNAGPSRVKALRKEAEETGLDPNRWFNNVELVAAKRIGRETVQYVSNIYKYYVAYQLARRQNQLRENARRESSGESGNGNGN